MTRTLLTLAVMLAVGFVAHAEGPTPVRVADAACGSCHRQILKSYLNTPMANASGNAADRLIPGSYRHTPTGFLYEIAAGASDAPPQLKSHAPDGHYETQSLLYFLGSGHLGVTYLYEKDHYLFESPVAWYAASHGYDMKPGLAEMANTPPALPMQSGCLRCHMSGVQHTDAGTINHYQGQPFLHGGMTCETCHGPTEQHVRSHGHAAVLNPAKLDAERRDAICISCHLEGDVSVTRLAEEQAKNSALDFQPGDRISDYLAFYVYPDSNPTARGVSEVEQFLQSTCRRRSGDRMSCTSCHDPHADPSPAERVSYYRSRCLACHSNPQFVKQHHPETPDCIGCHMPNSGAQNIPHVAWTDHRILRVPPRESAPSTQKDGTSLVPVLSPSANRRDLAMAYYQAYLEGNGAVADKAYVLLRDQRPELENDLSALDAFGTLSAQRGDAAAATAAYEAVLRQDPLDLTALSNLGVLRARQGDLTQALALLTPAFNRNRDVAGLAMNLARIQCMAGQASAARDTLQSALAFSPGLVSMQQALQSMKDCTASSQQGAR